MAENKLKKQHDSLVRKLSILQEINQAVSRSLNIKESMDATLNILFKSFNIKSGAVLLTEDNENTLHIAACVGFAPEAMNIRFRFGEGLTGKVAETMNPIVVPRVSKEPLFLNRLKGWNPKKDRELTYIGVPIISDYQLLGVLNITFLYNPNRNLSNTLKFFTLVASALVQPIRLSRLLDLERQNLLSEKARLNAQLKHEFSLNNIIGNSHAMQEVFERVSQVAQADTTVLIRGESGTGKELIAQAIHYNSQRSHKPFIRVNCAAIPETLIESEFFGYEKGAFTGAVSRRKGRFELADTGTIFLDEIGELSPMTQVKLLRVLQEQEFERVGGTETIKVDVRVIAATNADIEKLLEQGRFREDLYYRLNVFSIYLPPLRERRTDILLLADHFLLKYSRKHGKAIRRISTPAIDMLMRYHWPGNVRELENCIERAVLVCEDQVIHSYHLPPTLQTAESSNTVPRISLQQAVVAYEKELIQDALKSARGVVARAARLLDTTERIINYKIQKYGIDIKRFKN
ncbi:MAG: GAF domain-containing protein [Calditrichaeota bacterium]|nr:GAF domain-containing protein [Calditrichota bacterium]